MTGVLVRREEDTIMCTSQDKTTQGHGGKAAISKPGREASEDSNPAGPLVTGFQPQNCEQMTLPFQLLSPRYSVIVA